MSKKYVFLDIDGTLVGYDAKIPPSAIEAIRRARERGHEIVIASGRQYEQIYPELLSSSLFDGIICSTGAHVEHHGRLVYQSTIEGEDLRFILEYLSRENICYILQGSKDQYATSAFFDVVLPYMRRMGYNEDLLQSAYAHARLTDDPFALRGIEKLSYFLSKRTTAQMMRALDDRFYVVDFSVGDVGSEPDTYFGEITLAGVNKGSAVLRYLEAVGGRIEDTIAIGDSGNDIDMIDLCAVGVAMGNATEPIKAAADFVTRGVDNDGIYAAFEHLGLI